VVVTPRTALLAGATGLVGRALLSLLLASGHYHGVHVLLRRTPPDIKANAKLEVHQVDFALLPAAPAVDDVFSRSAPRSRLPARKPLFAKWILTSW
jgi:nucleoside-diphosphate-sugar epimerase